MKLVAAPRYHMSLGPLRARQRSDSSGSSSRRVRERLKPDTAAEPLAQKYPCFCRCIRIADCSLKDPDIIEGLFWLGPALQFSQ